MHSNPGAQQGSSIGRALLLPSNSRFAFNSRKASWERKRAGIISKKGKIMSKMGNDNPERIAVWWPFW
jgi:hypothetical protein